MSWILNNGSCRKRLMTYHWTHQGHPDFSIAIYSTPLMLDESPTSDAVITIHISAYVPQYNIQNKQNSKNKQSH